MLSASRVIKRTMLIALIGHILVVNFVICKVHNSCIVSFNNLSINGDITRETPKQLHNIENISGLNLSKNHEYFEQFRRQPIINKFDTVRDIYSEQQLNYSYTFFYEGDKFQNRENVMTLARMGLTAKLQSSIYTDLLTHHYDNFDELNQSGGPKINQELCLNQLEYFIKRVEKIKEHNYRTNDIDFYMLIDSFGRRGHGLLTGNSVWLGDYNECLKRDVFDLNNEKVDLRYCVLNLKFHDWTQEDTATRLIAFKMGVCLPKSCDSRMYKNKYTLVEKLANAAISSHDLNGFYVYSLYCLPDNESNLRIWYKHPKVVLTVTLLVGWIALLVYSTYKYEHHIEEEAKAKDIADEISGIKVCSDSKTMPAHKELEVRQGNVMIGIYKALSIKVNVKNLFNTSNKSSLLDVQQNSAKSSETNQPDGVKEGSDNNKLPIIDLNSLESIKVICMWYVILGHVLMCTTMVMDNGRNMASTTSISWFTANLTPAFAVNSFFCITGLLTSYLLFKTNQIENIMKRPIGWLGLIMYRYFRILPLYLIVVLYLKNVAKFTGSGPLWDYGTSSISQRRICERESILWTLLFGANFKSPFKHCIPSAWYLADDFQFFLVTPIFLSVLYKNKKLGTRLLILSIVIGYLAGIASIYMTDFDNLLPIAKFMPHGLKTYVTFFNQSYVQPQYRIPAYLIGLLAGFILHTYEHDKLVFNSSREAKLKKLKRRHSKVLDDKITTIVEREEEEGKDSVDQNTTTKDNGRQHAPDWPDSFKRYGLLLSAFCIAICFASPLIATRLPLNKFFARLVVAFIMPSYHVLFSIAVAIYILLSSTGHTNKLSTLILSSPLWKPFARLSLSVVLINIEVINYFIQTHSYTLNINDKALFVINLSSIFVTYIVAIIVCTLFEAPLRGMSNLTLSYVMKKFANKSDKIKSL